MAIYGGRRMSSECQYTLSGWVDLASCHVGQWSSAFSFFSVFFLSRRDAPGKTQTFTSIRLLLQTLSKWLLHIWIRRSILILICVYQPAHSGNLSKKKCLLPVMIEPVSSFGVDKPPFDPVCSTVRSRRTMQQARLYFSCFEVAYLLSARKMKSVRQVQITTSFVAFYFLQ